MLTRAFPWCLEHDPFGLDGLLNGLAVLDRRTWRDRDKIEMVASHPRYLTRWAAVERLWNWGGVGPRHGRTRRRARQLLRILAQDRHSQMRAEARWRLDEWRSADTTAAPRWRRAALAAPLRQGEPYPTFFAFSRNVGNYLSFSGESDYDEALVEAIITHLQAHPITAGYDPYAYWQAFETSRR